MEGPTQAAAAQSPLSLGGHRPAGWRGRQGTRRRAAAWAPLNSLSAPPPGALPGKPLLPAPLQTAGPRRRGVTEAAAGRVRRAGRRWVGRWRGAGRAGFHQVSRPRSRRRRCHRRCHHHRHRFSAGERANDSPAAVLSASSTSGAVVAAAPSRSRQVRGAWGRRRWRCAWPTPGPSRTPRFCVPPQRRAGYGLGSARAWSGRAQGGNAGGGVVKVVPEKFLELGLLARAGVEGIARLGWWHRPSCGDRLIGDSGSQTGPVAPGSVHGRGHSRCRCV